MSIKTKWVWGNKQEKVLLPRLALQYLLSNKRNKKCQVTPFQCAAEQTSRSTFHTSTQGCSQTHVHKDDGSADCLLTVSRQLKTLQVPADRKGQEFRDRRQRPTTSPQKPISALAERLRFCGSARVLQGLQGFWDVRRLNSTSEKMQMLSDYFWPKPIYKKHNYLQVNGK